jgi:hypothetical protein
LIIPVTIGFVTGHFEDKTMVAYYRSEVAIARLFIRVQYRSTFPQRGAVSLRRLGREMRGSLVRVNPPP